MPVRLLQALLPLRCALCGSVSGTGYFCEGCKADLPWIESACDRCGQPLALPHDLLCPDCQLDPPDFFKACAPLRYAFPVDSALKSLKFGRRLMFAAAFGELLPPVFDACFTDADALLPVPLHLGRQAMRGFNQAAELCRPLRRVTGLPLISGVRRVRPTKPQSGLDAAARRRNLHGAFLVRGKLRSKRPLIVDDVITTGETCRQLALALLDAGAERVGVIAVARAAGT